jgi:hypothetical protein
MRQIVTLTIIGPDPSTEPNNADRASRIDVLERAYSAVKGEVSEPLGLWELTSLLTDIRHFCDREKIDLYEVLDFSYQNYLEERKASTPTA